MNQTGYSHPQPNDKLVNYPDDVILGEVSTLYQFAEKSLLSYRNEIYEYLFPVFVESCIVLLKKQYKNNTEASRLFNKYSSYHSAFHEDDLDHLQTIIKRGQQISNYDSFSNYFQMRVTIRKSTKQLITNHIHSCNLQYILELENYYIQFSIIDDSVDDSSFIRSQKLEFIQNQKKLCMTPYIEEVTENEDCFFRSGRKYGLPSIAIANFSSRFDSRIICVRISKDGKNFAASTENGLVHLWHETEDHKIVHHFLVGHAENVMDMDFSSNGRYLLTGGLDGCVKMWLTEEGRCVVNYRTMSLPVWFVRFSSKNRVFMVAYQNALLQFFNTDDIQEVYHVIINMGDITAVSWSPLSNCYFVGYTNGMIGVFTTDPIYVDSMNQKQRKSYHRLLLGNGSDVTAIACMPKTNFVVVGYADGSLTAFSLVDCHMLATTKAHTRCIRKILCDSNKGIMTTISEDGYVKIWEIRVIEKDKSESSEKLEFFSFHNAPPQQQKGKTTYSFFMVHEYSIEGMEFVEGVMIRDGVMVVAGTSNKEH